MSDSPCKLHVGYKDNDGYGRLRFEGASRLAHRVAYCQHHGLTWAEIKGLVIRHTCDNPPCVEPMHLVVGTQADNMKDVQARCRSGQRKLTSEQVAYIRANYIRGHREFGQRALARRFGVVQSSIFVLLNDPERR